MSEIPMTQTKKRSLIEGPITPAFIADKIEKHQHKTGIGGHDIFLGQVRADEEKEGQVVHSIEYSAYEAMAEKVLADIREELIESFGLTCMHIYHSLGSVRAGELSLFVFVSASHRDGLHEALQEAVERIKARVPVFGKEIFENGAYTWKENRP